MKTKGYIAALFCFSILWCSCDPVVEPPADMGYNYFPLDTGRYYIYNVDSIYIYCDLGVNDTVQYQVKEYYESIVLDANNNPVIRIERYYRADSTQSWNLMTPDIWFVDSTITRLEKIEENIRLVKMIYPVSEGMTWDGNAFNVFDQQDYTYLDVDVPFNNGIFTFDSTVTVEQLNDTNMIEHYYFSETYARNIGMVAKKEFSIESLKSMDSGCPTLTTFWYLYPGLARIKKGSLVTYKLIEYGFE